MLGDIYKLAANNDFYSTYYQRKHNFIVRRIYALYNIKF